MWWGVACTMLEFTGSNRPSCPCKKRLMTSSHTTALCLLSLLTFGLTCHTTIEEAHLKEKEKSERGFKWFMIAHFFLWMYPKNIKLVKSPFKICLHYLQSDDLWYWPKKIHALKAKKIVWSADLDNHCTEILAISVDGVNFCSWEKKHQHSTRTQSFCEHNSCEFKHEIGIMTYQPKIVWLKGPIRCGKGDHDVFREDRLKEKLGSTPGKMGIADGSYEMGNAEDIGFLCVPSTTDSRELKCFPGLQPPWKLEQQTHKVWDFAADIPSWNEVSRDCL